MPKWTDEQLEAINKDGCNIIVSAGAGSGKTAVLTERVIRKLRQGVNLDSLLVLTFTNAAAKEMKERIRSAIKKDDSIIEQLSLIESSYITTFDSFSLSMVKKYYYLLGASKNINIVDSSVIYYQKEIEIDDIFNSLYEAKDKDFLKLIGDFCIKDDKEIKNYVLSINNKLDLLYDKESYLDDYNNSFFNDEIISINTELFIKAILKKIEFIKKQLDNMVFYVDDDYHSKLYELLKGLLESETYDDIKKLLDIKLPMLPKNSPDEAKYIKEKISNTIKEIKSICIYDSIDEIKAGILFTKEYVSAILKIIKELNRRIDLFKKDNNVFEFNDICKMAIRVLKENDSVRLELKDSLNEIMVDEYQDTSDLQELFISLIENNNVYMVGDIKQSIYRFRNANPYIFKNKYDNYSLNKNGYKIDLNKNFRSRNETLNNINTIFNKVMDDKIGGAAYIKSHQMIFGNSLYTENTISSQNNNFEIYNYSYDKNSLFTKDEIECFTVAWDIKNKIASKYKVFDKNSLKLRDVTYNDFVILMDRSTKFDLYKKIFEYLNIPLNKYTDTSITDCDDTVIVKNIVALIIKYYKKEYDISFKYYLMSIARSYLFRLSDNTIFDILDNHLLDNEIISVIKIIAEEYESLTTSTLIERIIDYFSFYENLIKVGNISSSIIRLEYIYNLSKNVENMNYDIEEFFLYLSKLIEENFDINVSMSDSQTKSVKIMTIHKSKGLEYPICYYTGLSSKFNISDLREKFLFDKKYGIIAPYIKDGIKKTINSYLFKENYIEEEISEKIRLFYVSLTRCREKMILVAPIEDKTISDPEERMNYRSFLDILNSIYSDLEEYITNININEIKLTKDYDLIRKTNFKDALEKTTNKITNKTLSIENKELDSLKFSKTINKLMNNNERDKELFGLKLHSIFEMFDFKTKNLNVVPSEYQKYIENFLTCGINFDDGVIYKEFEFMYNDKDKNVLHGIIDLVIEYEKSILIIDYKLKNTSDEDYIVQLNGYKNYIESKTDKKVTMYLYSVIDNILSKVKEN